MRYWVDGYNVIHRAPIGAGAALHERRAELLARIAASGMQAFVAFDSRERVVGAEESVPRRVEVAFATGGQSADQLLLERLRRARDLRGAILVSDDRDLRDRAPGLGVATLSVGAFMRKLLPAESQSGRGGAATKGAGGRALSKREVDDWMKWFGYERPPAAPAAAAPEGAAPDEAAPPASTVGRRLPKPKRAPKRGRR